jgi:hypothetical protein
LETAISTDELFRSYPQLLTLRALVPDALIVEHIGKRVSEYEELLTEARKVIPTVNLNQIFPAELERGAIRLENFLGHWGNVSIEELCKICLIVKWVAPRRILELGTYNGMTTLQMALNSPPECNTYTLDLPPEMAAKITLNPLDEMISKHFKEHFDTTVGSYFLKRKDVNITQLWGDTSVFPYETIIDGPIDMVFVDAAHDYQNKKIDTDNAFRLLSAKGVILWHNYHDVICPDVTRCLGEYAKNRKIWHLRNTSLAVYYAGRG